MHCILKKVAAVFIATAVLFTVGGNAMANYKMTQGTSNDNGDGTYLNPVLNVDVADPDVICAPSPDGTEAYYMVSTAMQYAPGCPIMKSTDMVNWVTVNNLFDTLDYNNDKLALRNGMQAYGGGQWATSIRYNERTGMFFILTFSYSTFTTQVYTSYDVENGPWKKSEFKCFHDPSIFIDDDDRIYVFYGQNSLYCKELLLNDGYLSIKAEADDPGDVGKNVVEDLRNFTVPDCIYPDADPPKEFYIGGEGTHAYKVDGVYYLISITWPAGKIWDNKNDWWRRGEICFRSIPDENGEHHIYGPYEGMLIMNQPADFDGYVGGGGLGQGGMTNAIGGSSHSSEGAWYGLIYQDRGALGRCPHLVNVNWNTPGYEGWPMMTALETAPIPNEAQTPSQKYTVVKSDEFNNGLKRNSAEIITAPPSLITQEETLNFNVSYKYDDNGTTRTIPIVANRPVTADGWQQLTGLLTTSTSLKYGRIEISAENPSQNFYIDDVSVTDANGKEYAFNSSIEGNDGEAPWWWNPTNKWDIDKNTNVDTAMISTTSREYHNNAPSMYVFNREHAEAGALQYLNDDSELKNESTYNVTVWVKYNSGDTGEILPMPTPGPTPIPEPVYEGENEYNGSNLDLVWQWNHNPDNRNWSLIEREGYMRLRTGKVVQNIQQARNTLTQRTFGPTCSGWTAMETSGMKNGDYAGLAAFAARYGFVGVKRENDEYSIVYASTPNTPSGHDEMMNQLPEERKLADIDCERVYFKTEYVFPGNRTGDIVKFYYSIDGKTWIYVDMMDNLEYSMLHFTGYKFALFNFATQQVGGYVDFDYFRVDDKLTAEVWEQEEASVYGSIVSAEDDKAVIKAVVEVADDAAYDIYAALYSDDGELISIEKRQIESSGTYNFELDLLEMHNYNIKLFIWDGMRAVTNAFTMTLKE